MGPTHSFFEANTVGRDYVVGDIHGMLADLQSALVDVKFNPRTDRLFSVGDLIDRGPESLGALELLDEPWFRAVRGNHEELMLNAAAGQDRSMWLGNGGGWSTSLSDGDLKKWAERIENEMPVATTIAMADGRTVGISHAEYPYDDLADVQAGKLRPDALKNLVWGRQVLKRGKARQVKNIDLTIHGHTPIRGVKRLGNAVFIDTGAVYDGFLTLMTLDDALKIE